MAYISQGPVNGTYTGGFEITPTASYISGFNEAGWSPSADQNQSTSLAKMAALGRAPSTAQAGMQVGMNQAQQAAGGQMNATRGNFGAASAQRNAMMSGAQMASGVVDQAAQQRAQEMAQSRQQYLGQAAQQRAQDLQASGLSMQAAIAQARLEQQQSMANQAMAQQYINGIVSMGGSAAGAGAMMSDEKIKTEVDPAKSAHDAGFDKGFRAGLAHAATRPMSITTAPDGAKWAKTMLGHVRLSGPAQQHG